MRCSSTAPPASRTRAGPRTARRRRQRASASVRTARSRSCTTASSRTTRSCATELQGARLRVRSADRHRGHRAPVHLLARKAAATCLRAVQHAVARVRRRLCDRRDLTREPHRVVGARRAARCSSASARARTSSPPTPRRSCRSRAASSTSKKATSPTCAREAYAIVDAAAASARDAHCRRRAGLQRRCRARPVPALHAEGDLRAAARDRRHARRRRRRSRPTLFGDERRTTSSRTSISVLILACGTSYYAGLVAQATGSRRSPGMPCTVEIASEYRYRDSVPNPNAAGRHHLAVAAKRPTRWPR